MMKKLLLTFVLFAVCLCPVARVWAADDPGDKFLEAYFLIQEGDAAERQSDWAKASTKYTGALEILGEIRSQSPDWNPHIIEFRTKYAEQHLGVLKTKLAAPAAPEPQPTPPAPEAPAPQVEAPTTPAAPVAPATPPSVSATPVEPVAPAAPSVPPVSATPTAPSTPAAPPASPAAATPAAPPSAPAAPVEPAATVAPAAPAAPAAPPTPVATVPPVENEQVKQLTEELQRARDQIQQLETARNELNAKLQEELSKVAPTQTNAQIEDLLKKNQELAAKLAAAQTEIAAARERPAVIPTPPAPTPAQQAEVAQLRTELAQTRGELQQTKQELQQTRVELGTTKQALEKAQADNVELRRSYESVIAQLTDANKKLSSAKAASDKDDEIIRQLRKENALLRIIAERKASASISSGESEESTNGPSIPELRGWKPHVRPPAVAKQQPKPEEAKPQTPPSAMEESGRGKLVATLTAPKKAEPAPPKTVTEPAKTQTNAPAKPVAPQKKSTPPPPPPPAPPPPPPPDERQLLNEARAALALKDLNTAAAKYDAVLGMEPTNIVALSNLGAIRYQQSRLDDAEQYLRRAVAAAPNDSNTRSLLGVVFFRKGLVEEAYSELNRAVALDPRNAEAHNYLGIVTSQKGWGAAGEMEIRRAIEINPQYADAHFNLAVIYAKQRVPKVELARYHYKKALDLGAPPDPDLEALLNKLSEKPTVPKAEEAPKP